MISSDMPIAANSGSTAAGPIAAKLGRSTTSTPAKATRLAIQVWRRIGSPISAAASSAVTIGLVKEIAVASAIGMI